MGKGRPRKRYGPVRNRGLCRRVREQAEEASVRRAAQQTVYVVEAGVPCHVRRLGEKAWRAHTTRRTIRCQGFLWRNERCYGFTQGDYEVKVRVGDFRRE